MLPSHLGHATGMNRPPGNRVSQGWARFQAAVSRGLKWFVANVYGPSGGTPPTRDSKYHSHNIHPPKIHTAPPSARKGPKGN